MNLRLLYYKDVLLQTSCGNYRGTKIKAKPLYVITLIDAISDGLILGNKLSAVTERIESHYERLCQELDPNRKPTSISMPFFHLNAEPYYHLKFKDGVVPPKQAESPSKGVLRRIVDFAYLDPDLWDLLQDPDSRAELRDSIVQYFFK